MAETSYKVWCGLKSSGYADNTVTVDAESREDAIKQALEYFEEFWHFDGEEWWCFEIQQWDGWYVRKEYAVDGEFELKESYLD